MADFNKYFEHLLKLEGGYVNDPKDKGGAISGIVPAGYYYMVRSVTTSGTPSFSYVSGQEVSL